MVRDQPDRGLGPTRTLALFDKVVLIGEGGDLRQVGHTEHLIAFGQGLQLPADSFGGAASNPGVDFVKDQGPLGGSRFLLP